MSSLSNFYIPIKTRQTWAQWPYEQQRNISNYEPFSIGVTFARDRGHVRIFKEAGANLMEISTSRTKKELRDNPPNIICNIDCTAEEFIKGGFDVEQMTIEGDWQESDFNSIIRLLRIFEGNVQPINNRRRSIVA